MPIGLDPTQFMVNLLLHYYKNKWILNKKQPNHLETFNFSSIFHVINNSYSSFDNGRFEKALKEVWR